MDKKMYINGDWIPSTNKKTKKVLNPASRNVVGIVPDGEKEDAINSIEAADEAFRYWSKFTAEKRGKLLIKAYNLVMSQIDKIAEILTMEQGKPLEEAKGEIKAAAGFLQWYGEEAKRIYGETIPASDPQKRLQVIKQPVGVVAAITPWNFPASMITRKIAPALAAGCTVVIKPAHNTPLTAIALFEIFEEAGFPEGVINLVTGKGSTIGNEFVENQKVKKISFTGSTEVGKHLLRKASNQVKRVSMELGGHAPFLVFEDADIDKAVEACVITKFRNAGQTCICTNRIYVQDTVIDLFAQKLTRRISQMKIGSGTEKGVEIGPLIDKEALDMSQNHVDDALNKGAELIIGGEECNIEGLNGYFYEPTILNNVNDSMKITYEETFGPVAPLISFSTEEEVLQKANNVSYGLAAYAFTNNLSRSYRVSEGLEYGIVGLNDPLPPTPQAPFGGWKESGLGQEGGHYGIDPFVELKYISFQLE